MPVSIGRKEVNPMNEEAYENPDLIIEEGTKIIDPETLSEEDKKELQRILEETGDEVSTDDIPEELYPEYEVKDEE